MLGARWVLVRAQASVGSVVGHTTDPLGEGRREALFLEAQNTHTSTQVAFGKVDTHHTGFPKNESTHNYSQAHMRPQKHRRHSGITALRVLPPPTEAFKIDLLTTWARGLGGVWWSWVGQPRRGWRSRRRQVPLGDMGRRRRVPPETPAPFGVLLAQDLLLTLALLLRAQVAVLLLQEPHRGPPLLLKMLLVFCKERFLLKAKPRLYECGWEWFVVQSEFTAPLARLSEYIR